MPGALEGFLEWLNKQRRVEHANVVRLGLSNWHRYHGFLKIILERYKRINSQYVEAMENQLTLISGKSDETGKTEMDEELWEVYQHVNRLSAELHLEVESFYIFAKILLDRIADTFGYFFGISWENYGSTHSELSKKAEDVFKSKTLRVDPVNIVRNIKELQSIIEYRNKEIEHLSEPRKIKGTSWGPDKKAKMFSNLLYPTREESDNIRAIQKETEDLETLLSKLDDYMNAMATLFSTNIERSVVESK